MKVKYLILGAGPTGLGAGWRLFEQGERSFLLLEKNPHAGGLSASFKDKRGFTWDVGGHVVFSHYKYFDDLLDSLLGADYLEHQREAWIRIAGTWVPYPFQNNIRYLPPELAWECLEALVDADRSSQPANFREWIAYVFGAGIARHFMYPYNFKVWATPPELMSYTWIGERVSVVDLKRVLRNIVFSRDDVSWGPNNTFRFPLFGGTGEIFTRLAARIHDFIRYSDRAVHVDSRTKKVKTLSGETFEYEYLLNTAPLDLFVLDALREAPEEIRNRATLLEHNGVFIAGVGIPGIRPDPKCWMYFPENNCPFYRVTNFHNYSPNNTANPGRERALMCEVSFSGHKPEDIGLQFGRCVDGLANSGMLEKGEKSEVLTDFEMSVEYGYPIPTLERDKALKLIQPYLESLDIYSRGRFGGWKYEVGNMDHSVMQGVEWAERMLLDTPETTYTL